tara:strand:+ start:78 stop:1154 length:1077 start_codon:yes stop_codon:yes gene_type:complete
MLHALSKNNIQTSLITIKNNKDCIIDGSLKNSINVIEFKYNFSKFAEIIIGLYVFCISIFFDKKSYFLSRNLYAAFFLTFIKKNKNIIYETHFVEEGIRGKIQLYIIKKKIKTIVISEALKNIIKKKYNLCSNFIYVLHDCGNYKKNFVKKKIIKGQNLFKVKHKLNSNKCIGYFGSLGPGRGMELMINLSKRLHKLNFLIFGISKQDYKKYKFKFKKNTRLIKRVDNDLALKYMEFCDILIMPYQKKNSIGMKKIDTTKWMSPIKMFEYLGSGTPMISSDLPVLKEILKKNYNSLLSYPGSVNSWINSIEKIVKNNRLERKILFNAKKTIQSRYSWIIRVRKIIEIFKNEKTWNNNY